MKEELGFDEAVNYRLDHNLRIELMKTCPNGIDMYFDNVGEIYPMLYSVISMITPGSRSAAKLRSIISSDQRQAPGSYRLFFFTERWSREF